MSNEAQISQLFQFIKQNKFHFESYLKLISICKEVGNDAELVRARQEFHNVFPIPLEEWREWIKGANSSEVSILYESALQECKSSELWADYLYYKIQNGSSPVEIRNQYSKAEREISSDYKSSSLVFNMFIDYELAFLESMHESSGMESDSESEEKEEKIEYEHEETAEKIEFCRSQFLTRLQTPHIDIEKTFEKYCMFESSFGGTKEEELKRNGSMLMTTTRNRSSIRDKLEYDLENLDYSLEAYHDYIYNEKKVFCKIQKSESDRRFVRESKNFIAGIYQRALLKFPYDSTLRKSLIIYLASIEYDKLYLIKQTELALKIFMTDIELWCYLLRFLKLDENGLKNAYLRGSKILNQSLSPFQSVSLLKATKLVVDESIHKDIEVVRRNYQKMKKELAQFSKSRNLKDDTDFNLERAMARFEFRNNNWTECTKILQECTKKLASVELFLEWITMANVQNPAICRDLYKKAMIKSTGNRELIYDSWIRYELINSSDDQLHIALGYIHSARERDLYRTVHDVQVVVHSSDSNKRKYHEAIAGSHKKQKPNPTNGKDYTNIAETSDSPMAPTKLIQKADAEKAVFVPLAEGMEKENLLRKASDFGEVNDYDVVDGGLYIEFKTIQAANRIVADRFAFGLEENVAVYKCLPRNWAFSNKECKDTVFVNHLPASSKKITLREAMVRFGKIIDIRLVSKPSHSFAYIQFEQEVVDLNQESATKSLALNNTSINGHSVSVAISDPTKKKVKTLDERELFVGNLPANVTEEVVRSHFARFGQVRIRTFRNTAFLHYSDKVSFSNVGISEKCA